jgi:hypothetical protein
MRYRLPETPDERSNARVLVLNHGGRCVINVGPGFRENGIIGNFAGRCGDDAGRKPSDSQHVLALDRAELSDPSMVSDKEKGWDPFGKGP